MINLLFRPGLGVILVLFTAYGGSCQQAALIKNIFPGKESGVLSCDDDPTLNPIEINNVLYFSGRSTGQSAAIWRSNGTEAGTVLVKEVGTDPAGYPRRLTRVGNKFYFVANQTGSSIELWISNGTTSGTTLVKTLQSALPEITEMHRAGSLVFFTFRDQHGLELWKSDGTASGTFMVKDINPGTGSSNPSNFEALNGLLYFSADDGTGPELWRSDGSDTGTKLVKDFDSGPQGGSPQYLTNINGVLYFSAHDSTHGSEPWTSDGTEAGTVLLKDIQTDTFSPYYSDSKAKGFVQSGQYVYFSANDHHGFNYDTNFELWRTDGTDTGTKMVKDISSPFRSSHAWPLADLNGTLLFYGTDDFHNGRELWKTTGSPGSTVMVANIREGDKESSINHMIVVGDRAYFQATSDAFGTELWFTDGTTLWTKAIDVRPGNRGSYPAGLTPIGNALVFSASTNKGNELYSIQISDDPLSVAATTNEQQTVSVFPNPATAAITINNCNNILNGQQAVISDVMGRIMGTFMLSATQTIDIHEWPSGIYFLKTENGMAIKFLKE